MKLSLKFQEPDDLRQHPTQLMTAKVPLTIFNHPFVFSIAASTAAANNNNSSGSEFFFSLATNSPSGPSLKLSYSPTASTSSPPFSLSLKSGLGLLGCPRNSPLVFSANFTLSPSFTPVPSFFLHFKPQFGHFLLHKTVFSDPNSASLKPYSPSLHSSSNDGGEIGKRFAPDGSSSGWQELKLEPCGGSDRSHERSLVEKNEKRGGLSPGVAVMARTIMPVTKGLLLNLRWGFNLPGDDSGVKAPYLTVNKIGLERVEEVKESSNKQKMEFSESELQLLKGMCFWMKRDMEIVEKENREMRRALDEIKMGVSTARNSSREGINGGGGRRIISPSQHYSGESSGEFDRWRSKKGVREESEKKEQPRKQQQQQQQSVASDVESELQKAIKAASAAASSS